MKVSIIGSSGKVGKQVIHDLIRECSEREKIELELVLVASPNGIDRIKGFLLDLEASYVLRNPVFRLDMDKITVTTEYSQIQGSDVVVVSCGRFPRAEDKEKFIKDHPEIDKQDVGRIIQSFYNIELISSVSKKVLENAKDSVMLLVTNQVDMLCEIARSATGGELKVIGVGGALDTSRFQLCLWKEIIQDENMKNLRLDDIECNVMGYHSGSFMFPILDSISVKGEKKNNMENYISVAMEKARKFGGVVSRMQKKYPDIDSGSSVLPAIAVVHFIRNYCFGDLEEEEEEMKNNKLLYTCNMRLEDKKVADWFGSKMIGFGLQVPCEFQVGKGREGRRRRVCIPSEKYTLTEDEKKLVVKIQNEMKRMVDLLLLK